MKMVLVQPDNNKKNDFYFFYKYQQLTIVFYFAVISLMADKIKFFEKQTEKLKLCLIMEILTVWLANVLVLIVINMLIEHITKSIDMNDTLDKLQYYDSPYKEQEPNIINEIFKLIENDTRKLLFIYVPNNESKTLSYVYEAI